MNKKEKAASDKAKMEIALGLQSAFFWTDDVSEEELEEFDQDDHELITTYIQKYVTGICSRLNVEEFSGDPLPPKKRRNKIPVTFIVEDFGDPKKVDLEKEEGR